MKIRALLICALCLAASAQSAPHGVTLSWSWTGTGTPTYNVYRATATGAEVKPALATGLTATTFTDSTAAINTKYFYTVTATVGGVESSPSPEVAAQIVVPTAPINPSTTVF